MQPVIYEKKLKIPYYLGDRYGQVVLPHLMNILIEASGEQINAYDITKAEDLDLHWIVIQYQLEIKRMPNTNEEIMIRTYIEEHNRLFSYRIFEVLDRHNNLMIKATGVFALIDENRKLSRIPKELVGTLGSKENRRIRRTPKPENLENAKKILKQEYKVRYFDIDTNFHANNSMYFMWMLDALGDDFLSKHVITSGNIVFEKEVNIDEKIESIVKVDQSKNQNYKSYHEIQVEDVIKCRAEFSWKNKNASE